MSEFYIKYSADQISKIGNTIIYLSEKINSVSKTKLLKLLYILDELSIKRSGIPFLNLTYKVWKFGPVDENIFVELSSEPTLLKAYIKKGTDGDGNVYILPNSEFNNDEFSKNDLDLLDFVVKEFGGKTAKDLVSYTHRKESPWYNAAKKYAVLDLLLNEEISNTEYVIDLTELVQHDSRKKEIYEDYLICH